MNYGRATVERELDALGIEVEELAHTPWAVSLCPLHDDSEPSFTIHMDEGGWKCYAGCGSSGDLAVLIAEVNDQPRRDVQVRLRASLPVSEEALAKALGAFQVTPVSPPPELPEDLTYEHGQAPQYIFDRGFTPETLRAWDVGYDEGLKAVVIPVHQDGVLVGLVRRCVEGKAKYLNTRFPRGDTLLGLDHLPFDCPDVIVVEGPLDAMWLYQHGFPAVALLGSSLAAKQADLLARRFWRVTLALDADRAGVQGALQAGRLLGRQGLLVRQAEMPPGRNDPQECSAEELKTMLGGLYTGARVWDGAGAEKENGE